MFKFNRYGVNRMNGSKRKAIRSDIVRDSINTFGTNAIGSVLGIISSLVVLRRVSPEIKGLYNTVQTWGGGFYTIIGLSVAASFIYFVARYKINNTKAAIQKICAGIFAAILLIGSVILLLLRNSSFFSTTPASFLVAIMFYGLSSFLFNICTSILRGENKFKSYNLINLIQRILVTILALVIAFHPSAGLWVWATNAISVAMIVMALYCIKRWNGPRPEPAPDDDFPVKAGSMVQYSLKSHVSNVLTYINTFLGQYIVQGKFGYKTLGIYNTAFTMMQQVWILPDAVSQVIMSRIASMKEQNDKLRLTLMSSKIVAYITTVVALLLLLAAKLFIPPLFPMYKDSIAPLCYLIVGSIFISYAKVLGNSIAAYGRPELNILPTALGVAANIGFNIALIPVMGINGVAAATSISLTVQGLSCVFIFCIYSHTPLYRLFVPNKDEIASFKGLFKK